MIGDVGRELIESTIDRNRPAVDLKKGRPSLFRNCKCTLKRKGAGKNLTLAAWLALDNSELTDPDRPTNEHSSRRARAASLSPDTTLKHEAPWPDPSHTRCV